MHLEPSRSFYYNDTDVVSNLRSCKQSAPNKRLVEFFDDGIILMVLKHSYKQT